MNPYREGSKLHGVFEMFETQGIEAAFKYGIEVAGLSPSTLKIQSKKWGGDAPAPKIKTAKVKAKAEPKEGTQYYLIQPNGKRLYSIKQRGEQATVIVDAETRQDQAVPNHWLIPTTRKP